MRFRGPVPALFLPLPSLFPSLPPDHLLFFHWALPLAPCDHARRATSCVSAVPFQPNGYPTVGRGASVSLSLALSLMASCAWSPMISVSPKSRSPPPPSTSVACPNIAHREHGLGFVTERNESMSFWDSLHLELLLETQDLHGGLAGT